MSCYLILNGTELVSYGTVVADPLPAGLTSQQITQADYDRLRGGWLIWNGTGLVPSGKLTPEQEAAQQTNQATIESRADAILTDLRAIRDSTGNLSSAQASNAVRVLARACIALIRLQLRKLDGTD